MSAASSAAVGAALLAGSNGAARSYTTDLAGKSPQQQVYQPGGGGGGVLYNLRAVIVHSGGINSGFNNMGSFYNYFVFKPDSQRIHYISQYHDDIYDVF